MTKIRRTSTAIACAVAVPLALGLSACGSFDSKASGEKLIRDYVKVRGGGRVTLKSVKCPSNVKEQVGGSFDCSVVLHLTSNNQDSSGSITVHMAAGHKVVIEGRQDVHVK